MSDEPAWQTLIALLIRNTYRDDVTVYKHHHGRGGDTGRADVRPRQIKQTSGRQRLGAGATQAAGARERLFRLFRLGSLVLNLTPRLGLP